MNPPNQSPEGSPQQEKPPGTQPPTSSAPASACPSELAGVSLEEALARLETIVRHLEEGQPTLDESLAQYEEGVRLLRHCYQLLEKAERRIELLAGLDAQGNPIFQPLEDRPLTLEEKAQTRDLRRSAQIPPGPPPIPPSEGENNSLPGSGGLF